MQFSEYMFKRLSNILPPITFISIFLFSIFTVVFVFALPYCSVFQRRSHHNSIFMLPILPWEHAVAQLVEALRYKPEGRGFDSRWCHWNFSVT